MNQILTYLKALDFSDIETQIYLALLKKSPMTIKEIAQEIKIQRTRAYPYVSQLLEKGVIQSASASSKSFSASSVGQLQRLVEQKITHATHLQKTFPQIAQSIETNFLHKRENKNDLIDFTSDLVGEAFLILYEGRSVTLKHLIRLISINLSNLAVTSLSEAQSDKLQELTGLQNYLQGRIIACVGLPQTTISEMTKISAILFSLGKKNSRFSAYGNILLSDAYYIAGSYSNDKKRRKFYTSSLGYAKKAWDILTFEDPYKLLAMRNIAANAIYLENKLDFLYIKNLAEKVIEQLPSTLPNTVYALQLCGTLDRGSAYFKMFDHFTMSEKGKEHFSTTLQGYGSFEVSNIREQVETLSILERNEKKDITALATKGFILAEQDNLIRYKDYFTKILPTL